MQPGASPLHHQRTTSAGSTMRDSYQALVMPLRVAATAVQEVPTGICRVWPN